jgi:mannose-6-phosphate isomerase-like protein (cupin superfamily)
VIPRCNVLELEKDQVVAHNGAGKIRFCRPYNSEDFDSNLSFVDYVEVPANCSIGEHRHGNNEEVYFIVSGSGLMRVDGTEFEVKKGDLIPNEPGGTHSLSNHAVDPLCVLVWEVSID